jgi:hypothetical protein
MDDDYRLRGAFELCAEPRKLTPALAVELVAALAFAEEVMLVEKLCEPVSACHLCHAPAGYNHECQECTP